VSYALTEAAWVRLSNFGWPTKLGHVLQLVHCSAPADAATCIVTPTGCASRITVMLAGLTEPASLVGLQSDARATSTEVHSCSFVNPSISEMQGFLLHLSP
jgi:hypothetical protein